MKKLLILILELLTYNFECLGQISGKLTQQQLLKNIQHPDYSAARDMYGPGDANRAGTAIIERTPELPTTRQASTRTFPFYFLDQLKDTAKTDKNLLAAPHSLYTALCVSLEESEGQKARVFQTLFGSDYEPGPPTEVPSSMKITNRLFIDAFLGRSSINPKYIDAINSKHGADIKVLDFSRTARAVNIVNYFVNKSTNGLIQNIIDKSNFEGGKLLILSATYFKGKWMYPFGKNDTKVGKFRTAPGKSVDVQMMTQTGKYGYAKVIKDLPHVTAARIPYKGKNNDTSLGMVLVMPNRGTKAGLDYVLRYLSLNPSGYSNLMKQLKPLQKATVRMPRFAIENNIQPFKILKQMGLKRVDVTGILKPGHSSLTLNNIQQDSMIKVDEQGTEAAAVSISTLVDRQHTPGTKLNFDRPFIFFINSVATDDVYFVGVMRNPSSK